MELERIRGLGPQRAQKLRKAGLADVKALAEADLRRIGPIEGISSATFQKHKAAARRLLDRHGIAYGRSPYGTGRAPRGGASRAPRAPRVAAPQVATAASNDAPRQEDASDDAPRRRGLLGRLLGRR